MTDVVIGDTLERACAPDLCAATAMGDGLVAICGAIAELSRFRIEDSARCGIMTARGSMPDEGGDLEPCDRGGTVDLHAGLVSRNAIGVNIQTEGFALERLTDGVLFRDNGVDLDSNQLVVPEVSLGL